MKNQSIKTIIVADDGFIWKRISPYQAKQLFYNKMPIELYVVHDDGVEELVENVYHLAEAVVLDLNICIEVGLLEEDTMFNLSKSK